MSALAGKTVLVTGASRGIGLATARALVAAGAAVVLSARSAAVCEDEARSIAATGGRATGFGCDVADYESVVALVDHAQAAHGRLDAVVNNVGMIEPIGPLETAEPEAWAASVRVNLIGAFHVVRAALGPLKAARGTLINVSSGAAGRPLEGWSAYCAGKAGLAMLTRSVALELDGAVRVYGLRPGMVDTDMQAAIRDSGVNEVSRVPREQLLPPSVPAAAVVWLAGTAPADLSGTEVDVRDPDFRKRAGLDG